MTILCSDKTGTLTTAEITIKADMVLPGSNFEAEEILTFAAAAANADKLGDPIDSAILRASGGKPEGWTQRRLIGFSPVTKRTLAFVTDPNGKDIVIAKGILSK